MKAYTVKKPIELKIDKSALFIHDNGTLTTDTRIDDFGYVTITFHDIRKVKDLMREEEIEDDF